MRKRILTFLVFMIMIFSLVGCTKLVSTECENVEVSIVDKYYRGMYLTPVFNGKTTTFITHPAVYRITVEYNGVEYTISSSDTYNKYKEKVGQTAIGTLEIRTYDDGSVKYDITALK